MAQILDGKKVAGSIEEQLKKEVAELKEQGIEPGLATILVGEDPASQTYVKNKIKTCHELGIHSENYPFDYDMGQEELTDIIMGLNENKKFNGILVQLPLPKHINDYVIIDVIDSTKDVDGFTSYSIAKLQRGEDWFKSCTPYGIIKLLDYNNIQIEDKNVVIIGRGKTVGLPAIKMMLDRDASVRTCHSKNKNLKNYTTRADILIVAINNPNYIITKDMVKPGAVVIDTGIYKTEKGLRGNVDFDAVKEKAGWITPVPGGIGPMTVAMLMYNTVQAAKIQNGLQDKPMYNFK